MYKDLNKIIKPVGKIFDKLIYYKIVFYILFNKPRSYFKKFIRIKELYNREI